MNKTININLGGYALIIDEDAYDTAHHYLMALSSHFGGDEGATEIMQDIETRMGELINRKRGTRIIVNKVDVVEAIAVLGTPEELKDINFSENTSKSKRSTGSPFSLKTGKRLYRDENDKVIGGVCSGLAAYFGIQDAVWIRIAFVILTLLFGSSLIVYMVLWAIVPPAKTVSDRLEMMGEPTNVNNIARAIKEELEEMGDKIHDKFGEKFGGKFGHKFGRKSKKGSENHKDDDTEQILTSGWTWNYKTCRNDKMKAPYNKKDFV
ncbi:MAG TPA: PspC domain-containing protein [Saprospiraceae bacterium]|nr:PspC domain-containing protein [Saprospiraceae bacterium]